MKSLINKLIATFTMGAAGLATASVFACDGVNCQRESSNYVQTEEPGFDVSPSSFAQAQPQYGLQQGRGFAPQGQQFSSENQAFRGPELPGGPQRQQFAGSQGQSFGPQGQQQFRPQGQGFAPQGQQFSGPQGQQQFRSQGQQFGPQGKQQFRSQGQGFAPQGQQFSGPQGQQQFPSQGQQFDPQGQGFRPQGQQGYGPQGQNQFGPQGQGYRPQGAPTGPQGQPSGPIGPQGQQLISKPSTEGANPKVAKALAGLAPEDRALAERQGICPVTGEQLGLMGTPVKVDVNGRPVFVCCGGCKEDLLANPNEYLAKLKN